MIAVTRAEVNLVIDGAEAAVRDALGILIPAARDLGLGEDQCGSLEILLAEVLNNIVEHAYRNRPGRIEVSMARDGKDLRLRLVDHGREMPESRLPDKPTLDYGPEMAALPEGGFGWFMIHDLAQDLSYRRHANCNELRFKVPV